LWLLVSACESPPGAVDGAPPDPGADAAVPVVDAGPPDATARTVSVVVLGGGRVVSDPPGLDCTAACAVSFLEEETVTLTATAAPGQLFGGFSGTCTAEPCVLPGSMGDQSVHAVFTGDPAGYWKRQLAGTDDADTAAVAAAATGHVVVAGNFHNQLDLGGASPIEAGVGGAVFVARFDRSGALVWARAIDGARVYGGRSVAVDAAGDVLVGGAFGTSDFGDGQPRQASGSHDLFIAKYRASDGALEWVTTAGGPSIDVVRAVVVDGAGDVVVAADYRMYIDLGDGVVVGGYYGSPLAAKYHGADGAFVWKSARHTTSGEGWAIDVGVDGAGNVYSTGYVKEGGGQGAVYLERARASDGQELWTRAGVGGSLAVGPGGEVFVAGTFAGSWDFGGGPVMSHGGGDGYLVRVESDGAFAWARTFGGAENDMAVVVRRDLDGRLVVGGSFTGQVRFGDDAASDRLARGERDAVVVTYDTDGDFVAAATFGGAEVDEIDGVAAGGSAAMPVQVVTGRFTGTITLFGATFQAKGGVRDPFVLATYYPPMNGEN
jgi:hypothetical protein